MDRLARPLEEVINLRVQIPVPITGLYFKDSRPSSLSGPLLHHQPLKMTCSAAAAKALQSCPTLYMPTP